jgi:hypothetical protein
MSDFLEDIERVEEWRPVPGYRGYEASNLGRVRSWRQAWLYGRDEPRLMKAPVAPCAFRTFHAMVDTPDGGSERHGVRVGTFVALAFLGPRPDGAHIRRLDGDPTNDLLENLAYGTYDEVLEDHAARVRREEAEGAPTHCPEGHEYAATYLGAYGRRRCSTCVQAEASPKRPETARRQNRRHYEKYRDAINERRRAEREWADRTTVCTECGVEFISKPTGPKATYCPDCRRSAWRAADRRYRDRKRAAG